jgi:hypothetical protein
MTQLWLESTKDETHRAPVGYPLMNFEAAMTKHPALASARDREGERDREVIRVDFAHDKQGIAAALRHAFSVAAQEPCDIDFDRLLSELH